MYPDFGYKWVHAQSVCTRSFLLRREGPGDEARFRGYYVLHDSFNASFNLCLVTDTSTLHK